MNHQEARALLAELAALNSRRVDCAVIHVDEWQPNEWITNLERANQIKAQLSNVVFDVSSTIALGYVCSTTAKIIDTKGFAAAWNGSRKLDRVMLINKIDTVLATYGYPDLDVELANSTYDELEPLLVQLNNWFVGKFVRNGFRLCRRV